MQLTGFSKYYYELSPSDRRAIRSAVVGLNFPIEAREAVASDCELPVTKDYLKQLVVLSNGNLVGKIWFKATP